MEEAAESSSSEYVGLHHRGGTVMDRPNNSIDQF